jgi:diamine N-acetyltransferase
MNRSLFTIIPASKNHLALLKEISVRTFSETYQHLNTPENFILYIDTHFNTDTLAAELDDENSFTYLLYSGGQLCGYLKLNINEAQTEHMPEDALEIERIYVLKDHHGSGAGKALLKAAFDKALELHKKFVWLGVWNQNPKAIAFYERNGFEKFGTHIFTLGNDEQEDYLYKYIL